MVLECPLHSNSPGDASTDLASALRIEPMPELDESAAGDTEEADGVGAVTGGIELRLPKPFSATTRVDRESFGVFVLLIEVALDFLSIKEPTNHSKT